MRRLICGLMFLLGNGVAWCGTTPMDTELPEDSTTRIECEAPNKGGTYHYDLYIPKGYHEDKKRHFPLIFITSPGGNAKMGKMAERLKGDRWIVAMLVESSNNNGDAQRPNFYAAHDDVVKRVRVMDEFKFATGMSGGARCVSGYPTYRDGFRGVILQAAGFGGGAYGGQCEKVMASFPDSVPLAATFGSTDFNLFETQFLRRTLCPGLPRKVRVFEGGHGWAPEDHFNQMMDWMLETVFMDQYKLTQKEPQAYLWHYENLLRRLEAAKDGAEQYRLIKQVLNAIKRGRLTKFDSSIREKDRELTERLRELKKSDALKDELLAATAWEKKVLDEREDLAKVMQRGKSEFEKRFLTTQESKQLEKYRKALQKVVDSWPETHCGRLARQELDSLTLEFKGAEQR